MERDQLLRAARSYADDAAGARAFEPGVTYIPAAGKVVGADELEMLVDAAADLWLTTGRYAERFEKEFAAWLGVERCLLCNSGSSANLLAVTALTSPLLEERRLVPGDEVITVAAGFPTTVNPVLQSGLIPVYVDVETGCYNALADQVAGAVGPRTKAIVLAHTLGNPFDVDAVAAVAKKHGLWLVEDNCDAIGSTWRGRKTGTFGDLATFSFYPAHHITMGEGGAVVTGNPLLARIVESFRDWGRDCWCPPGCDDTCGRRFEWKLGGLPDGYDHKYIYRHIGYNLKTTDLQAAVGCAQLKKLEGFIAARKRNFQRLRGELESCAEWFILPEAGSHADPSWFGFPMAVRESAAFSREDLLRFLEGRRIGTRLLFGGNLLKQPAYAGTARRVPFPLENTDFVMKQVFWIGVWPGLTDGMIEYMVGTLRNFCRTGK